MTAKRSTSRKSKGPAGGDAPAKPGTGPRQVASGKGKPPLTFYTTNWDTWFEIDGGGYRRKGGLDFVRLFVSASGPKSTESTQFLQLMAVLRMIAPDRYHHNRGIYFDLVGLTATLQKCYRGWFLDEGLQPLTEKGMAARLLVSAKIMRQAIRDLRASGLLQRRRLPEFDPSADKDESEDRDERKQRKGKACKRDEKPEKTRRAKGICKDLQTFAKVAEPFARNTELTIDKIKQEIPNGQEAKEKTKREDQTPTSPAATPPEEGQGPGPGSIGSHDVTMQAGRHHNPQGHGEPAITPPARVFDGPRIVPLHHAGEARPIGQLVNRAMDGMAHGQVVRADDFAGEIFALLQAPFGATTRDGCRELGNYRAAWLDAIEAGLSSAQMEELRAKGRKDAAMIGSHRRRYYRGDGGPERYWRFLFGRHLDARRRGVAEARAGPASAAM